MSPSWAQTLRKSWPFQEVEPYEWTWCFAQFCCAYVLNTHLTEKGSQHHNTMCSVQKWRTWITWLEVLRPALLTIIKDLTLTWYWWDWTSLRFETDDLKGIDFFMNYLHFFSRYWVVTYCFESKIDWLVHCLLVTKSAVDCHRPTQKADLSSVRLGFK